MDQRPNLLKMLPLGDDVLAKAWPKVGATLALALLFVLLPVFLGFDATIINVVLFVAIFAVLALGLNVVVGYTGLLELGYVSFLATGAIFTADVLLLVDHPQLGWVLPLGADQGLEGDPVFADIPGIYLLVILASGLLCALLGLLRGIPTLKLTGDYYAIVTLGLAEILFLIYLNQDELTGGAFGITAPSSARPSLFGDKLYYDSWQFYYLVLGTLGATVLVMDRLNRSRIGRAWAAIRLDEVAARACGIDVAKHKLIAFAVSGFFGGVGGSLYAVWSSTVAAKSLDVWQSILILCAVVLGGMGSLRGVLLGSFILFPLRELLREDFGGFRVPPEASNLVYGLLLIIVMRFRPQGLLPRAPSKVTPMTPEEHSALLASTPRLFILREPKEGAALSVAPAPAEDASAAAPSAEAPEPATATPEDDDAAAAAGDGTPAAEADEASGDADADGDDKAPGGDA
jgi:branched-chain amino acid transport system permease protein